MNRPQLYSKYCDLQKTDNIYTVENFLDISQWKEGDKVMDIGCGDGNFTVEYLLPRLPENFGKLVACDCSEKMLDYARNKHASPKIEFIYFDIASEEIDERFHNYFNHIYSFYTMHWVKKQRRAFKNIFKMLTPGGDILFTFLASSSGFDVYQNLSKYNKWKDYSVKEYISPYHNLKNAERHLEKLLEDIGFEVKVCKLMHRSFLYPNFEMFKNAVIAVNPIVQKLPLEETEIYIQDFMTELSKLKTVIIENVNNNNEKTITEQHKIFIVVAKKPQKESKTKNYN